MGPWMEFFHPNKPNVLLEVNHQIILQNLKMTIIKDLIKGHQKTYTLVDKKMKLSNSSKLRSPSFQYKVNVHLPSSGTRCID